MEENKKEPEMKKEEAEKAQCFRHLLFH